MPAIRRAGTVGALMTAFSLAGLLVLPSSLAAPGGPCEEIHSRSYTSQGAGWADYESLVVGTSSASTSATLTHTRTFSKTVSVGGSISTSVQVLVAEIKAEVNANVQATTTVSRGESVQAAIPANSPPKELRDGIKIETYLVDNSTQHPNCKESHTYGTASVPFRWFEVVDH